MNSAFTVELNYQNVYYVQHICVWCVHLLGSPHMWSRNKINSISATIYFISALHVQTLGAEIN